MLHRSRSHLMGLIIESLSSFLDSFELFTERVMSFITHLRLRSHLGSTSTSSIFRLLIISNKNNRVFFFDPTRKHIYPRRFIFFVIRRLCDITLVLFLYLFNVMIGSLPLLCKFLVGFHYTLDRWVVLAFLSSWNFGLLLANPHAHLSVELSYWLFGHMLNISIILCF